MTETATAGSTRAAPGDLEVLRGFLNTYEIEDQRDLDADGMTAWLAERALLDGGSRLDDADLGRLTAFREALRDALEIEQRDERQAAAIDLLNETATDAPLTVRFDSHEKATLVPVAEGVEGAIARLLAIAFASIESGTWSRLKTCKRHDCRWVFYDHSRNRSSNWCSMEVCGNRTKVERFRERQATPHSH